MKLASSLDIKVLNVINRTHPFNTVRAAELQRWVQSGGYDRVLSGDYPRRGEKGTRPLGDDYADAAGYYGGKVRDVATQVGDIAKRAGDVLGGAFRGGSGGSR